MNLNTTKSQERPQCQTCQFWSDKIAYTSGGDPVRAWCLQNGDYTIGTFACDDYIKGLPIDY